MHAHRPLTSHLAAPAIALVLLVPFATAIAGCGGSASQETVVRVGSATVDKATLAHWMHSIVGGDYFERFGHKAPIGLVSEPANYRRCSAAAMTIVPKSSGGKPELSPRQITGLCQELYRAIKSQALGLLISGLWAEDENAQQGIRVSAGTVQREYEHYRTSQFPTQQAFKTYVADHEWTPSDVKYHVKRNLLEAKLAPQFEREVKKLGGGERANVAVVQKSTKLETARTDCSPGFVVSASCRQYKRAPATERAPDTILEALVKTS
jgi:hypothetical protein